MDNFNLEKYQGLWYEHKFHDWTQFKEVYDTTLGIKVGSVFGGRIDFSVIQTHLLCVPHFLFAVDGGRKWLD
jgi:hypothetical protein